MNSLKSQLESLLPRLEGASSAASDAHEVVAIESNLDELEAWLVTSGKFCDNQHILRQVQEHRVRERALADRERWEKDKGGGREAIL